MKFVAGSSYVSTRAELRARYIESIHAPRYAYPNRRPGYSEQRARYWEWRRPKRRVWIRKR